MSAQVYMSTNVTIIERNGRTFYIVGTAHVSNDSVEEVKETIREVQPDTVCVELCETRFEALSNENRWENLNIFEVIREQKVLMLLANLAIGAYQRRIGRELGVTPGAEMIEAISAAKDIDAEIGLIDRDIQVTLKRTWSNVGFFKKIGLLGTIVDSLLGGGEEVTREKIEELKEAENLSSMMEEFAEAMPEVKEPLIDERDLYMVSKLREVSGERIVVVVGAGHVDGMTRHFDADIDRPALEEIPPPKPWVALLKWVVPLAVLCAFYIGYMQNEGRTLNELLMAWALPNAVFGALFTAIAGGRFFSILVAAVASPVTSLNPLLPVGVPVGFTEAWLRKPTVQDAQRIPDDVQSLRGFYKNPFTRTLLVTFMSILGSALGAWLGLGWLVKLVS
jgi:pheromone shutdown-related protein TraB